MVAITLTSMELIIGFLAAGVLTEAGKEICQSINKHFVMPKLKFIHQKMTDKVKKTINGDKV